MEKFATPVALLILAIQFHGLLCINAAEKTQICNEGPCNLTCGSNNICNQTCSARPCHMSCNTSNVCMQKCQNGSCDSMSCDGASVCNIDCEGGSCPNMQCSAKQNCQMKCHSSCSMVLSSPSSTAFCNVGKCNITFTEKSTAHRMVICPGGDCNIFCPAVLDCSSILFMCPTCTVTYYGSTSTANPTTTPKPTTTSTRTQITPTTSDASPVGQTRNVSILFSMGFLWTFFLGFFPA